MEELLANISLSGRDAVTAEGDPVIQPDRSTLKQLARQQLSAESLVAPMRRRVAG